MSNERQKRPDPKEIIAKAPPSRRADLAAELQRPEIMRALQKAEGGIDAELAAQLAPSLGNDALQELLKSGSETSTGSTNAQATEGAAQEEEQEGEEEQEQDQELDLEGEAQAILPSFSGVSGVTGASPWDVGKFFGGDGDADAGEVTTTAGRWRPMPYLPEPEDLPIGGVDDEDPAAPGADDSWLDEARRALGKAPWTPGLLQCALRDPLLLCRPDFEPETLALEPGSGGLDTSFGRARVALALLAEHAEPAAARRRAWTLVGAGPALAPRQTGYSGATARALHGLSRVLEGLSNRSDWERILDVRLSVNARASAEQAVQNLPSGTLGAGALFGTIVARARPRRRPAQRRDSEPAAGREPHPAALVALASAARLSGIPRIEPWLPEASADDRSFDATSTEGVDAVIAAFTRGPAAPGTLTNTLLEPLFTGMNALLDALGLTQLELAAAAFATVASGADEEEVRDAIAPGDAALIRLARRLVRTGRAMEALLGGADTEALTTLSWEAVAVREGAVIARSSALSALALLVAPVTVPREADPPADAVAALIEAARFQEARSVSPPDLVPGIALREGRPELAAEALSSLGDAGAIPMPLVLSLRLGIRLTAGEDVQGTAFAMLQTGKANGNAFAVAEGAIASTVGGIDPFLALREAAPWLRQRGEGGALSLLLARWGELRMGRLPAPG